MENAYATYDSVNGTWGHDKEEMKLEIYPDITSVDQWIEAALNGTLWTLPNSGAWFDRDYYWGGYRSREKASQKVRRPRLRRGGFFKRIIIPLRIR